MKVALDATYSLGSNLSGVGVYSRELLLHMAAEHPECRFTCCYRPHRFFRSFRSGLPANCRRFLLQEPLVPRFVEIFHGLNQRLPRIRAGRRRVATFHDLFVLTADYSTPEFRERFADQARHAATESDAVIAVSEFTARQVHELLGVERSRIHVIHHGVRSMPAGVQAREHIVLHVGAIQRRKNIARLVRAFETTSPDWKLVLAGSLGYGSEAILRQIEDSPSRGRILLSGYVPDAELARWYARASIFAFPSLDEGFGMPVLEAMAAGLAVLTSDRSALSEVAGQAALLVDPEKQEEVTEGLLRLTSQDGLRNDFIERGLKRAAQFTWQEAVRRTWKVYESLV